MASDDAPLLLESGAANSLTRQAPRTISKRWLRLAVVAVIAIAVIVVVAVQLSHKKDRPSGTIYYQNGAAAADAEVCSQAGVDIMQQGGNAVDAAIAMTLCVGVVHTESSGIGGGGFMILRNASGYAEVIDFREMAPAAAHERMFEEDTNCTDKNSPFKDFCSSRFGGLASGVPGELRGLELAWRRHGRLPWKQLFQPAIKLAREGFKVSTHSADALKSDLTAIQASPSLRAMLTIQGRLWRAGDTVTLPKLADTLEQVSEEGSAAFYEGAIAQGIVNATMATGGNMTLADIAAYQPLVRSVASIPWGNMQMLVAPAPASGHVMGMMFNILRNYPGVEFRRDVLTYHRLVETFKFTYAKRTELADPCCNTDFACYNKTHCDAVLALDQLMLNLTNGQQWQQLINDTRTYHDPAHYGAHYDVTPTPGTTHLSVIGPDGDAVGVTSTVNLYWGNKVVTPHGIVMNNEMDDFSSPNITNAFGVHPSPANFIRPDKRPLSSSSPTIVVQDGEVRAVAGASGGTRITTATAQALLQALVFDQTALESVSRPRLHHQLLPDHILGEERFNTNLKKGLLKLGHYWKATTNVAVCQMVLKSAAGLDAGSDPRKGGQAAGF
eukprot:TRINITY_DN11822_c1_g1_i2.p1 TRINITY_DN11822_c1_g1~~TRINITY_DN11822_c1_g1_i2.p1  ORF type:complete len:612 (+),score=106.79 TRINITY_DN11822_c1_g1_i2:1768-3603(+)